MTLAAIILIAVALLVVLGLVVLLLGWPPGSAVHPGLALLFMAVAWMFVPQPWDDGRR
jgi:hypothetical protein